MWSPEPFENRPKTPISRSQNTLGGLARPLRGSGPKSLYQSVYTMGTYQSMVQTQISYFFHYPLLFEPLETPHLKSKQFVLREKNDVSRKDRSHSKLEQ